MIRFRSTLRALLAAFGVELRRLPPPLLAHELHRLRVDLDLVLGHYLGVRRPGSFFFVQVGAFDGVTGDPIHRHVVEHGWRGVVVEPQREAFQALTETYRHQPQLILKNLAVAARAGPRPLYKVAGQGVDLPSWAAQLASFRRETLERHRDAIPHIRSLIMEETVECVTFADLLDPLEPVEVDLLQIDAEGYDFELVKLFHATGRRAAIVHFEHKHLSRRELAHCVRHLAEHGYHVALNGPDTIAYRR